MRRTLAALALLVCGATSPLWAQARKLSDAACRLDGNSGCGSSLQGSATLPTTCTPPQAYQDTDATANAQFYLCTSLNTWTLQTGGGIAGATTALDNLAAVAINTSLLFGFTTADVGNAGFSPRNLYFHGSGDTPAGIELTGTPTASVKIWTFQDSSDTVVGRATTDTLANKTLTTPTIGSFTNATHDHTNAAGGGTLNASVIAAGAFTLAGARFANNGTTSTLLHGNASGNPAFGAVALATEVSGTLPCANMPALTGAVTTSAGACPTSIASGNTYATPTFTGNETHSGTVTTYNGVLTEGIGVPATRKVYTNAGLTAALGSTTVYTPSVAGQYMISVRLAITTAATSGTITTSVSFTESDTNAAATATLAGTSVNVAGSSSAVRGPAFLKASTAVTVSTTFNTVVGTPTYTVYVFFTEI